MCGIHTSVLVFEDGCLTFATGNEEHFCLYPSRFNPFFDQQIFLIMSKFSQDISGMDVLVLKTENMLQAKNNISFNLWHRNSNLFHVNEGAKGLAITNP